MEHLERDVAAEVLVVRAVDVGHAAGPDPPGDPVAAVDDRVLGYLGHVYFDAAFPSSVCNTCLAIGAATVPPSPWLRSIVTATAIFGLSAGA